MKKKFIVSLAALFIACITMAQKPKATYDHSAFAKKTVNGFNMYGIENMCADYNGLKYISAATGKTMAEVTEQNNANKASILVDVEALKKRGVVAAFERAEVKIIEETPLKIADIIMYCKSNGASYTLIFKNCIQSNTTWILGDHIEAGEGIDNLISANEEKKEKASNTFLGKLAAKGEEVEAQKKQQMKKDSADRIAEEGRRMTTRQPRQAKGYKAVLFPQQGTEGYTQYVRTELINQSLPGYYLDKNGKKTEVTIKYWEPYTLLLTGPMLEGLSSPPPASDIMAFYVADQMFVQYQPGKWAILISEGAIRKLVSILKSKVQLAGKESEVYSVINLIQKLNGSPENYTSLSLQFANSMAEYVKENQELAGKIRAKSENYTSSDRDKIILEYNHWYDKQFPRKVSYLPLGLPEPPEPVEPVVFVPVNSKEELKTYLAQKEWEIILVTPVNGSAPITGADKVLQLGEGQKTDKYLPIQLFSNGTVLKKGAYAGTWDTRDKHTVIISTVNGNSEIFGIRFTQADQFVADIRGYTGGPRESISTYKVKKALTDN